jgi:UMF1 family MFS transporter
LSKTSSVFRRDVISWSLYDFANTIYSMNILSLYLKRWIVVDLGRDGLYYDIAYSISMLLAGILMPALGAVSDHSGKKKIFLFLFTFMCCLAVGLIPLVPSTLVLAVVILFAISNFFYEGGMVFYNSLLYSVSEGNKARLVSGFGVALGYMGSIAGMVLVLPFVSDEVFGMDIPLLEGGKNAAFLPTAILFFIFSLPLFIWVKEREKTVRVNRVSIRKAYREVWEGIRDTRKYPGVLRFLIADYFFEDAVATVILNMGIYSSLVIGFADADLTVFFIISTTSAMLGSFVIGHLSQGFSLKKFMSLVVWGWIIVLAVFITTDNQVLIYILGSLIGILLGGLWTLSRPLLAEMVPRHELGRFFGLYSLSGRSAAVIGPVLWGVIVYLFNPGRPLGSFVVDLFNIDPVDAGKLPYRLGVISLILIMAMGLFIFQKIPERNSKEDIADQ